MPKMLGNEKNHAGSISHLTKLYPTNNPGDDDARQQPAPQHPHLIVGKGYCTENQEADTVEY